MLLKAKMNIKVDKMIKYLHVIAYIIHSFMHYLSTFYVLTKNYSQYK